MGYPWTSQESQLLGQLFLVELQNSPRTQPEQWPGRGSFPHLGNPNLVLGQHAKNWILVWTSRRCHSREQCTEVPLDNSLIPGCCSLPWCRDCVCEPWQIRHGHSSSCECLVTQPWLCRHQQWWQAAHGGAQGTPQRSLTKHIPAHCFAFQHKSNYCCFACQDLQQQHTAQSKTHLGDTSLTVGRSD